MLPLIIHEWTCTCTYICMYEWLDYKATSLTRYESIPYIHLFCGFCGLCGLILVYLSLFPPLTFWQIGSFCCDCIIGFNSFARFVCICICPALPTRRKQSNNHNNNIIVFQGHTHMHRHRHGHQQHTPQRPQNTHRPSSVQFNCCVFAVRCSLLLALALSLSSITLSLWVTVLDFCALANKTRREQDTSPYLLSRILLTLCVCV